MGVNLNNITTNYTSFGLEGPSTAQGPHGPVFHDGVSSLGGLQVDFNYNPETNFPVLPNPSDHASGQSPLFSEPQGTITSEHLEAYGNTFSSVLEHYAQEHGLSEEQVQTLAHAQLTGDPIPDDTFLNDILGQIEAKVEEEMLETFGEDAFPSVRDQAKALKESGSSTLNATQDQLSALQDYVDSLPEGAEKEKLQQFINQAKNNLDSFSATLAKLENNNSREGLDNLIGQLNRNIADIKEHIGQAHTLSSDPNVGTKLASLVKTVTSATEVFNGSIKRVSQENQMAQGDWSGVNNELSEIYTGFLDGSYGRSFDAALAKYAEENNLSPEQTAQLRFAHFNPDKVSDPAIKGMLKEVQTQALQGMSDKWGFPPGYSPSVDNTHFNAEVEFAFDDAFNQLLQATDLQTLAKNLNISETDAKGMIEFLHFNPELAKELVDNSGQLKKLLGIENPADFEELMAKLSELEEGALSEISQKYGLPAGHVVKSSNANFNAKLNGRFLQEFEYNLKYQEPPLTPDQIRDIRVALADPMNPSISAETKNLIQKIYSQTVEQIRAEYNLPVGWAPPVTLLGSVGNVPSGLRSMQAITEMAGEQIQLLAKYVEEMPNDPAKALILNVMKIISQAISALKETIAQLQMLDAEMSKTQAITKKDAALYKVELQQKKLEEMRKKKGKMDNKHLRNLQKAMKVIGPSMKFGSIAGTGVIAAVTIAIAFAAGGPFGLLVAAPALAMMAVMTADAVMETIPGQKGLFEMMSEEIKDVMPNWAAALVTLAVIGIMAGAAGGPASFLMFGSMLEDTRIIQTFVAEFTDDPYAIEITGAVVSGVYNMGAQVITGIWLAAVTLILAAGLAAATAGVGVVAAIGAVAAKILSALKSVFSMITKVINALTKVLKQVMKAAEAVLKAMMRVIKAVIKFFMQKVKFIQKIADKAVKKLVTLKNLERLSKLGKITKKVLEKARKQFEHWVKSKVYKKLLEMPQELLGKLNLLLKVGGLATDTAAKVEQGKQSLIERDLALIRSTFDAEIEQIEALIKILQKVLDKMQQGMEGMGTWLVDLGNLQNTMWSEKTQTASAVAGANEA